MFVQDDERDVKHVISLFSSKMTKFCIIFLAFPLNYEEILPFFSSLFSVLSFLIIVLVKLIAYEKFFYYMSVLFHS